MLFFKYRHYDFLPFVVDDVGDTRSVLTEVMADLGHLSEELHKFAFEIVFAQLKNYLANVSTMEVKNRFSDLRSISIEKKLWTRNEKSGWLTSDWMYRLFCYQKGAHLVLNAWNTILKLVNMTGLGVLQLAEIRPLLEWEIAVQLIIQFCCAKKAFWIVSDYFVLSQSLTSWWSVLPDDVLLVKWHHSPAFFACSHLDHFFFMEGSRWHLKGHFLCDAQ